MQLCLVLTRFAHTTQGSDEYGDETCTMGIPAPGVSCFNALHMYKLGWAEPQETLALADLKPGAGEIRDEAWWAGMRG